MDVNFVGYWRKTLSSDDHAQKLLKVNFELDSLIQTDPL